MGFSLADYAWSVPWVGVPIVVLAILLRWALPSDRKYLLLAIACAGMPALMLLVGVIFARGNGGSEVESHVGPVLLTVAFNLGILFALLAVLSGLLNTDEDFAWTKRFVATLAGLLFLPLVFVTGLFAGPMMSGASL